MLVAVSVLGLGVRAAWAQTDSANKATANALFDEGRDLMKAGKTPEACAKFEASLAVLAQLGTRLNLADCYDKVGRVASAWAEFREAASLASRLGDAREPYAGERVHALETRLPRLTIVLGPGAAIPELRVTRDGVVMLPALMGSAAPVDPGTHEVTGTAPGFKPWQTSVTAEESKAVTVAVPPLEQLPATEVPTRTEEPSGPSPALDQGPGNGRTQRILAYASGGAGIALLAAGTYFGLRAFSKWNEAKDHCDAGAVCDQEGVDLVNASRSAGTLSTVTIIAGGAAVAGGVILFFTAPRSHAQRTVRLAPAAAPGFAGAFVTGRF